VIKVLSPELVRGLNAERFEREILLAASLQQANTATSVAGGAIAFVWCMVMFFMMVGWHIYGKQNLSPETYRTTPQAYAAKAQAVVDKYTVRTETDMSIPVVHPPAGSDVYLIARLWSWWPILEAYKPKLYDKIPANYRDPDGVWTGIYVGALGLAVNTKVLKDKNLPEPVSWADLTKPIYKGQISMAHPASSGTAYTMVATQAFLNNKDIEKTFAYLRLFHANVLQYQKTGAAPARIAGQGEVAIGIVFSHDIVAAIDEGFKDLKVVFPSEGTGYEIGGEALVKNAPDPIAGKTFLDWALGVKAQELAATFKAYQIPTNPDAKVSEKSVKLSTVKTVSYDFQWAGDNKKAIVDRFSNEVVPAPK